MGYSTLNNNERGEPKRPRADKERRIAEVVKASRDKPGLSLPKLCQRLGLHHSTVRGWIREGLLPDDVLRNFRQESPSLTTATPSLHQMMAAEIDAVVENICSSLGWTKVRLLRKIGRTRTAAQMNHPAILAVIQGLQDEGFPSKHIANALGISENMLRKMTRLGLIRGNAKLARAKSREASMRWACQLLREVWVAKGPFPTMKSWARAAGISNNLLSGILKRDDMKAYRGAMANDISSLRLIMEHRSVECEMVFAPEVLREMQRVSYYNLISWKHLVGIVIRWGLRGADMSLDYLLAAPPLPGKNGKIGRAFDYRRAALDVKKVPLPVDLHAELCEVVGAGSPGFGSIASRLWDRFIAAHSYLREGLDEIYDSNVHADESR